MLDHQALTDEVADATHYLECIDASSYLQGVETTVEAHYGSAASTILSLADSKEFDLIVMCSHGRTGLKRWVLGSIAEKVVRLSPVPVLVLRDHGTPSPGPLPYMERPLRILVSLDGSVIAKAALAPAMQLVSALAAPGQGAIHLVRVVKYDLLPGEILDPEARERLLHKAKVYLQSVTGHVRAGLAAGLKLAVTWSIALDNDAAAAIITVAENGEDAEGAGVFGGCDLIALSTHGRGGLQRWAMGSVTERVLSGTRLPLLIVRPPSTAANHGTVGAQAERTDEVRV